MAPTDQDVPQIAYEEDEEANNQTVLHDFLARATTTVDSARPALVIVGGLSSGRVHPLRATTTTIGRSLACDIVIEDGGVSRRHAQIVLSAESGVRIEDLGSSNGLVYQGQRVSRVAMRDGDRVGVGEAAVSILHMDELTSAPPSLARYRGEDDAESGMLSRIRFLEAAQSEYAFALKHRSPLSFAIFSIDHLPSLLDQHGANLEGALVQRVAQTIRDSLDRPDAKVGRLARERVALLVPELTPARAIELGSAVCASIAAARIHHDAARMAFGVSAGVGSIDPSRTPIPSLADVLEEAEVNMHLAIVGGRGRCVG